LERHFGFEVVALSGIIDIDLGLCLDSIFTNEMQIIVGYEHTKRRARCWDSTNCRPAGSEK
jgi:hypothetical protein